MYIERIEQLEKGRRRLVFETGERLVLYKGEIRSYDLSEGQDIPETLYQELLCDVLGKRATKRAMHLLEKQDRTEYQLREKTASERISERSSGAGDRLCQELSLYR